MDGEDGAEHPQGAPVLQVGGQGGMQGMGGMGVSGDPACHHWTPAGDGASTSCTPSPG